MANNRQINPAIPRPSQEGSFASVDELVNFYKHQHYDSPTKRAFFILLAAEALLFISLTLTQHFNSNWLVLILLLPMPWLIETSYVIKSKTWLKHDFMKQFAEAKRLNYIPESKIENAGGWIISEYFNKPRYFDIISGAANQVPFTLFNYEYRIRVRNGTDIVTNTVLRLEFSDPVPRLFLQCFKHPFLQIRFCNGDNPQAHLDENLDKIFTLWTLQGLQMEGLQIFTAGFTQPLAEKWSDYHIEFINNYAYLYPCQCLVKIDELERMLELAQYIASKLPSQLKEMKSDIEAVESYKNV